MIYEKENGHWKYSQRVHLPAGEIRQMCINQQTGTIWIGTAFRGVTRIKDLLYGEKFNSNFSYQVLGIEEGLPSLEWVHPFKLRQRIIFGTKDGLYGFDPKKGRFFKDDQTQKTTEYSVK